MCVKNVLGKWLGVFALLVAQATSVSYGLTVNRLNGGANVIYVDFSVSGSVLPLELIRSYNSITAVSESTGWKGAFGWGWTSPFETTFTLTPDRHVLLRDGATGNTIMFRPQKEDPNVRKQFFEAVKKAYFERERGRKLTSKQLKGLTLPERLLTKLKADPNYRVDIATKYGVKLKIPRGEMLVSSQYGFQTMHFANNQWIRNKDGVTQYFDKEGRLVRQEDKNNYTFTFFYDAKNPSQISEIRSQDRTSLKFKWNQGKVLEVRDNRNRASRYVYDKSDNLIRVTDSNNQVFQYKYANTRFPHLLTRIEYPTKGRVPSFRELKYDKNGLVTQHVDRDGIVYDYVFGKNNRDPENNFFTKTTIKDPSKKKAVEHYDEFFLKPRPSGTKYLYKQVTKRDGVKTVTTYTPCCGKPAQIVRDGVTTNFKYYPDGLLKERISPNDYVKLQYHPKWKKITKVDQNKFVSTYQYDGAGNLVKASNSRKEKVALTYDRFGRILKMIDGGGKVITFRYDGNGKPSVIEQKGVGVIRIDYDSAGRIRRTETVGKGNRRPSQAQSQRIIKRVMQGFQNLLDIIRPAGVSLSNG